MTPIITGLEPSRTARGWSLALLAGVLFIGCDKVPLLAPPESTISVTSGSKVVQTNGKTEIRAIVLESSGTAVQNGTTVLFTTTLGAVTPTEARTTNGVATAEFVANGQSGTAVVKAISGGAVSEELSLMVGAAAATRVVATASPNQISSGGSSTITAKVTDASGNPLSGASVSFSTDSGSLSSSSASTSTSGEAQVTLTATRDATVTATVAGGDSAAPSGTVKVTVAALPEITIAVSATPTEGAPVTFTITVTETAATERFQSLVIDFGDGTSSDGLSGGTQTVAHVYQSSGTYTVAVTGTSASGATKRATTVVSVADVFPVSVAITRVPADAAVNMNVPVTFTAAATGATPTTCSWTFGDGSSFKGGCTVTHAYSTSGTKTVNVTLATTTGATGKGQMQLFINP
jgi:adhesin/invasin